jgi:hypothetical protein
MTELAEQNVGAILSANLGKLTIVDNIAFGVGSSRIEQRLFVQKTGIAFDISLSYWRASVEQ